MQNIARKLFLRHALAWACLLLAAVIIFTAPWWWQKLTALPCATLIAAISIRTAGQADRHRELLKRIESIAFTTNTLQDIPPNLIPYLDPLRASNRTGQIVYQFVRPLQHKGTLLMTTTLEQLIASFLQIGLAKLDTKLSPATQQLIDTAVPTLVSTIASVVVDLAENHKATKAAAAK